jgi:hypothetical protein
MLPRRETRPIPGAFGGISLRPGTRNDRQERREFLGLEKGNLTNAPSMDPVGDPTP